MKYPPWQQAPRSPLMTRSPIGILVPPDLSYEEAMRASWMCCMLGDSPADNCAGELMLVQPMKARAFCVWCGRSAPVAVFRWRLAA